MSKQDQFLKWIEAGYNCEQIMKEWGCHKSTVRYYLKRLVIETPPNFYVFQDKKIGRPKGFKHTREWKQQKSLSQRGENNPFYGCKHSSETRKRMSQNHADVSGDNNPFRKSLLQDPKKREQHKERCKQLWALRDEDVRRQYAERLSLRNAKSDRSRAHKNHKSQYITTVKAGKVFCRSSWEVNVCNWLDDWTFVDHYALEPFAIKYVNSKGRDTYTRIDFLITLTTNEIVLLEVKPASLVNYGTNPEKIKQYKSYAEQHNYRFELLTENDQQRLKQLLLRKN